MKPRRFYLEYSHKKKEARNTYTFFFKRRGVRYNFQPGQYNRIFLEIKYPDERGTNRYFTISSSPLDKEYLTITTRIIKSSFKKSLLRLKPGTVVRFFGPIGTFLLNEDLSKEKVFLAGGIGVTPFRSTMNYFSKKRSHPRIILIASFKNMEEMVFYEDLNKLVEKDKNLKVIYTLTRPEKVWSGEKGRISSNLILKYIGRTKNKKFFIVGPPQMVRDIGKTLENMGIPVKNIFREDFTGY